MKKLLPVLAVLALIAGAAYYFLFGAESSEDKKAYNGYVEACVKAGEKDYTCRCQANLLRKELSASEMNLITEVGQAVERNDMETVSKIQTDNPKIFEVLQNMPDDVANCVLE
jgi:hypothetical protein